MISVLIGGGLGALLGYFGKCSSGACPLTANPWRGAIYGALLGGLFYYVSGGSSPASMNKSTANIKLIKEGEFDAEVVQSSLPVVVDFYATWCGPCKLLAPMLDELAGPLANQVKFVKSMWTKRPPCLNALTFKPSPRSSSSRMAKWRTS